MGIPSEQAGSHRLNSKPTSTTNLESQRDGRNALTTPHDEKIHIKKILESHAFDKNRFFSFLKRITIEHFEIAK